MSSWDSLRFGLLSFGVAVSVGQALPVAAQNDPTPPAATEQPEATTQEPPSRLPTKVRQGSLLRHGTVDQTPVDMRGEYERRRDHAVRIHYERLARLDRIAELAVEHEDTALADRADAVRRAEVERFRLAMHRLRVIMRSRGMTGLP